MCDLQVRQRAIISGRRGRPVYPLSLRERCGSGDGCVVQLHKVISLHHYMPDGGKHPLTGLDAVILSLPGAEMGLVHDV